MTVKKSPLFKFRSYTLLALIGWTIISIALLLVNLNWLRDHIYELAIAEARASIEKDVLYRRWATGHGGVYVPVTETTQPNPYLNVSEREISTPSGRILTLVNPAYMTRQVYEMLEGSGDKAHLTSLDPFNPNNVADEWEQQALQSFENGATEIYSLEMLDGEMYMRVMKPFIIEESCLKCHANQGYKTGDIRGGLSVSMPMAKYDGIKISSQRVIFTGYGVLWAVGISGILFVSKDLRKRIDERETILAAAQKNEIEYRSIIQTSMDGFWLVDQSGKIMDVNDAYCAMTGYSRGELLAMQISDLEMVEKPEDTQSHIDRVIINGPDRFETFHKRRNGETFVVEISVTHIADGKLAVFIRDITSQKDMENQLKENERKYRLITDNMQDNIWLMDMNFKPTYITPSLTKLRGFTLEELQELPLDKNLTPESKQRVLETVTVSLAPENISHTTSTTMELEYYKKDGSTFWSENTFVLLRDENGNALGILGNGRDITERKKAEEKLRENERLLLQAQQVANLGYYQLDIQSGVWKSSNILDTILGIDNDYPKDVYGWSLVIHPADREQMIAYFTNEVVGKKKAFDREYRIQRVNDLAVRWVHGLGELQFDDQGVPIRMIGTIQDITERKIAESALRNSEERYRLLFDEMMDGFALHEIICDENGKPVDYRFLAANQAFEEFTGLRTKDIIGKTVLEVLPGVENFWIDRFGKVALTGIPEHFEEFSAALNAYYEVRSFSPAPNQFAVVFHDISTRKYTEDITLARMKFVEIATTQSLDTLVQTILDEAEALTNSRIGFYHFLEADQITLTLQNWSTRTIKEFCRAEGKGMHYPVNQAGVWVDCVKTKHPIIHNDYANLPNRRGLPPGHAEVVRELVVPVMRGEKVVAILGVGNKASEYTHRDVDIVQQLADLAMEIVERKRAEDAQAKAQQDYESLIQTIDGIVWEADPQTLQFNFVSSQAERLLGYPTQSWINEKDFWLKQIHPDDREQAVSFCMSQTAALLSHEFEYRMIAVDGRIVWLRDVVTVLSENGRPSKLRGIMIDITEKKLAEEKLRQLSLAVEQNPVSVMITDLNGAIEYVNPKFTEISGYTLEEVIGQNLHILKSEETPQGEYHELWATITSGMVWRGELHNRKKNGELFWEDVMIAPMKDTVGKITHFIAVKEDVTERKRALQEIQQKNTDLAALFSISSYLRTAASAKEMLSLVLQEVAKALHSDANAVILLETDRENFLYAQGEGLLKINEGIRFPIINSISGQVLKTRQVYITEDLANDPKRSTFIKSFDQLGSSIFVPLQSESEFIGVLLCARNKRSQIGQFTQAEIQLLSAIGEMAGNALRRARLYDDALLRMQRLQALRAIDAAITSNMNLGVILNILFAQALGLMNMDAADILIFNPHTLMLEYTLGEGFKSRAMEQVQLRLGEGLAGTAALERRSIFTDIRHEELVSRKEVLQRDGIKTMFISPMVSKGQLRGVLELYSRTSFTPNEEWMDFLGALATQAAIAIDNAQLYNDLQRSNLELSMAYEATIEGWSHALDLKDKETEGHTLRVTDWTMRLAHLAGLSDTEIAHIRRGALLHDIGKMGIPDHILHKTGTLTENEWKLMRQHPIFAYNMLHPIEFLHPAIDIPYCHHEKWDGTGYPRGLKGIDIPYAARLFAVVDVWDAVTSDRPYRKAWSHQKAIDYIKSESGKHFDPDVVNLFLSVLDDLRNTT